MRKILLTGLVAVGGFLASCTATLDVTNGTKDAISVTVNGGTAKSIAAGQIGTFGDVPAGLFDANPNVAATGRLLEGTVKATPLILSSGNALTISNNAVVLGLKNDTATSYIITNLFVSSSSSASWGTNLLGPTETIAVNATKWVKIGTVAGNYDIKVLANDGYTYTQLANAMVKGENSKKWNTAGFYIRSLGTSATK